MSQPSKTKRAPDLQALALPELSRTLAFRLDTGRYVPRIPAPVMKKIWRLTGGRKNNSHWMTSGFDEPYTVAPLTEVPITEDCSLLISDWSGYIAWVLWHGRVVACKKDWCQSLRSLTATGKRTWLGRFALKERFGYWLSKTRTGKAFMVLVSAFLWLLALAAVAGLAYGTYLIAPAVWAFLKAIFGAIWWLATSNPPLLLGSIGAIVGFFVLLFRAPMAATLILISLAVVAVTFVVLMALHVI
jgi:hypothetical protein